jgi:tetratricopeptide (TPR) repeat protein
MDTSDILYSLDASFTPDIPDYSERVLLNDFYVDRLSENTTTVKHYEPNDSAVYHYEMAETFFQQRNMEQARNHYQLALKADPTYYKVMVYIGDTYYAQQRYSEALTWYRRAIDSNYIDYLAHWACANALVYLGQQDKALREITIAKVLNRNNPRLTTKLMEIYRLNKKNYNDWYFTPLYELSDDYDAESEKITVKIRFKDYWMSYAMAKAVWKYEPGYAEAMDNNLVLGEKEAVFAYWMIASSNKAAKKTLPVKVLKLALDNRCYEAYVIYEALLPENPNIALYLGEEGIGMIVDYILDVRSKVKK